MNAGHTVAPGLPSEDPDLSLQNYPRRKGGLGCQPDPKEWGGGGDLRTQQLLPTSPPTKSPGACVDSTEHQGWGLAAMECAPSRLLLSLPGSLPTTALPGLGTTIGPSVSTSCAPHTVRNLPCPHRVYALTEHEQHRITTKEQR